jgi:hypothetical protein
MKKLYTYPQETWDEKKCAKIAKHRGKDGCGSVHPYPGLVAASGSSYPQYGQTVRFNGGTIIEGELYQYVMRPLPKIPDTFEFIRRVSWGTYLQKKS